MLLRKIICFEFKESVFLCQQTNINNPKYAPLLLSANRIHSPNSGRLMFLATARREVTMNCLLRDPQVNYQNRLPRSEVSIGYDKRCRNKVYLDYHKV